MYNTFNMGIGMCMIVAAEQADDAVAALKVSGEQAFIIGSVETGEDGVTLC
jgi:phosphoribosylformylglycinamidine cyclo-ligase